MDIKVRLINNMVDTDELLKCTTQEEIDKLTTEGDFGIGIDRNPYIYLHGKWIPLPYTVIPKSIFEVLK